MLSSGRLFRYVPGISPLHRLWAGTKLAALAALGLAVVAVPNWPVELATLVVLLAATAAARLPRGVLPRPPRWLLWLAAIPIVVGALSGGAPAGFGGLLTMLRLTGVALEFLGGSLLLTATTRSAELPGALAALAAPLRPLRVPVDDLVAVSALSVRCLPLLTDEVATAYDAWRLRLPAGRGDRRLLVRRLIVTVLTVAVRRARELAEAMHARGGAFVARGPRPRLGAGDAVAVALVCGVVAVAAITG